jgi:hypothetical protein
MPPIILVSKFSLCGLGVLSGSVVENGRKKHSPQSTLLVCDKQITR